MTKDEIRTMILSSILDELEFLTSDRGRVLFWAHQNRSGQLLRRKLYHAAQGIVLYKPSTWLGRPLTGSERVQFCKMLRAMAEDGLLICYTDSRRRTTHVELTETGREEAEQLLEARTTTEEVEGADLASRRPLPSLAVNDFIADPQVNE